MLIWKSLTERENKIQTKIKEDLPTLPIFSKGFAIVIGLLMLLSVAAVVGKIFYEQTISANTNQKEMKKRHLKQNDLPYSRAQIVDRNGRILATSVPLYSLVFSPRDYFESRLLRSEKQLTNLAKDVEGKTKTIQNNIRAFLKENYTKIDPRALMNINANDFWLTLAQATQIDYDVLIKKVRNNPNSLFLEQEKKDLEAEKEKWKEVANVANVSYSDLMAKIYQNYQSRYQYVVRQVQESDANYLADGLDIATMSSVKEPKRYYPLGEAIAPLLGLTQEKEVKGIRGTHRTLQGSEGLELSFNSLLIGRNGQESLLANRKNRITESFDYQAPYNPMDVVLSIDEDLQAIAYHYVKKAVAEHKAIFGTAVLVDINTGEILAMASAPSYNPNNRETYKNELARNRAITDTFEPGSTVKPLVVLTALEKKATYLDEIINTGPLILNDFAVRDVSPQSSLSLTGILQKSSNRGVSRLALRMPPNALVDTYKAVGFGQDTNLGLGEQKGVLGDRKRWADVERATYAYGYGLTVTPVQLAKAYATLGSFGLAKPLSIIKVSPPVDSKRVLPEKITREVVKMMEAVAAKGEGGQRAAVDGYRVAIKTGTARKIEGGKYVDKYLAYTAGIAPASDPRFALVVLIDEPKAGAYYGGAVSAPLFSSIMGETLRIKNIKPDNL
ncbi:penicillin-binding transpeptidase domain-containing protein [Haemophilus paracuniculus]|nr:penicillin-binding transpeptidase domain-containing protein [Haemophilus paracuniculus]